MVIFLEEVCFNYLGVRNDYLMILEDIVLFHLIYNFMF